MLYQYFIRRFLLIVPTFLGVTLLVFMILQFVPGGPLEQEIMKLRAGMASGEVGAAAGTMDRSAGVEIPEAALEEMKRFYGFDKPIPYRYSAWLFNIFNLNLGRSYVYATPVWSLFVSRLHISLYFGIISFIVTYSVCVPLGVFKAIKHSSAFDTMSSILVFIGYSIPGWALGLVLLMLLGGGSFWDVFPLGDFRSYDVWDTFTLWEKVKDQVWHTVLPVIAYMITGFATLTVVMKNSLLENLSQDYVRTAFAKGLSEKRVIFLHTLRNSLIPIATGIGGLLAIFFTGSYFIERVFNIDGLGMLGYMSVIQRDYPVTLGFLVMGTIVRLIGNIVSDMAYAAIDPRIRFR